MTIDTQKIGQSLIARLNGELDMHTSEVFRQKADAEMVSGAIKNLVLVMSSVSFIDSSGVGAIIGRYRTVKDRQGKMVLVGLRPAVRRVLDMSGVLGIADATDTERHALARL